MIVDTGPILGSIEAALVTAVTDAVLLVDQDVGQRRGQVLGIGELRRPPPGNRRGLLARVAHRAGRVHTEHDRGAHAALAARFDTGPPGVLTCQRSFVRSTAISLMTRLVPSW